MINQYFFIITIIFYFLMVFYLKLGAIILALYFLTGSIFLIINFLFNKDEFISIWRKLLKTNSFKYLLRLIVWTILGILYSSVTGDVGWAEVIRAFLGGFVFSIIFPYITSIFGSFKLFNYKLMSKLIFLFFLFIFLYGVIQTIGNFFGITLLNSIDSVIRSKVLVYQDYMPQDPSSIFNFGMPRMSSIFQEPSFLAYEIVLISPMMYLLCFSKHRLFENIFLDFILRKFTFILMIIDLLFTQSPIFVILGIISISFLPVLLTIKKILQDPVYIVRVILISAFVLLVFVNILSVGNNLDISETFLNRVVITFKNIDNYEGLIAAEPSLATRIGLYVNYFILGLKNPILGIGYGNLTYLIDRQLALSPIPLTSELTARFTHNAQSTGGSPNIFFRFLAETGIVGIIFLYLFFFSLITAINKNLPDYSGIEKEFLTGLKYFLIALIITSIYDSTLNHPINWIIIGIIQAMITNTVEEPATRIRKINIEQLKTITEGT